MRAVFHIGRPKTGSTTLQMFLQRNRKLIEDQGVFYGRTDKACSSQWEFPIKALANLGKLPPELNIRRILGLTTVECAKAYSDRMMEAFERRLAKAPAQAHTWVGSSEQAWPFLVDADKIRAFDDLLKRSFDSVTYVVYLRRPEELALSEYSEAVRRGAHIDRKAFVKRFLENGRGDNLARLEKWTQVVGRDKLVVRLLERDALHGTDLIEDFCSVLGVNPTGMLRPTLLNSALTEKSVRAFRLINRHLVPTSTDDPTLRSLRDALCSAAEDWGKDDAPLTLSQHQTKRIRAHLAQSNEGLRQMFFPERAELFPERRPNRDGRATSPADTAQPEMTAVRNA